MKRGDLRIHGGIQREIMELSLSDSQPCSSKWAEAQSKRSGHCCSIDYQWKMSDSLSQVSLFHPTTHTHTHTHRQTAKSYVALRLNSFARWKCLRASCESYPVSSTCCTQRLLRHPFPIHRGGALQRAFVEHTVSFIGQTLNLKAWWGVY